MALPIVAVAVSVPGSTQTVRVKALLDGGSNRSFCSPELLELLGVSGSDTKVTLETMTGVKPEEVRELSLCLQGTGEGRSQKILLVESVLCMPSFPDLLNCQVSADMASNFSHLRDIPLPSISRGVMLL